MKTRVHKFVGPTGESVSFELDGLEAAIRSLWKHSVDRIPYQLVDEFNGSLVLRFARHIPHEIAADMMQGEVDLDQVVAWVVVANHEKTEWTLHWVMPIMAQEGPGELFYLDKNGIRVTAEDMRKIR